MATKSKAIEKVEKTGEIVGMNEKQWDIIGKKTPDKYIMTRPGRGRFEFKYVQTGYMIELLNKTFNGMWDFEIIDQQIGQKQIWVKGKLTCKIIDKTGQVHTVTKTQYGSGEVKGIDIGDDLKGAASDCLKKCASMLGFASDLYWGGEHLEDEKPEPKVEPAKVKYIYTLISLKNRDADKVKAYYRVESMNDLTESQAQSLIDTLNKMPDKPKAEKPAETVTVTSSEKLF